ncbi:hypothetical protein NCER_100662 [Vairimorpha ceranae BRL01]|uniref:Ribosomal protein L10 n=2 Tax=Vairimorpha ceranae TaxID=40302 RepID=C4V857_VAIC1|nr:ribosomal protein l10-like protein [Vairimorpha ceranae]EEQ82590.1 hypothetical protein NCER_100662 [Vairimorpha ceranae BRL01]KKO75806.1 ribosomal protein l10-like protein [Vairimorpha ceranae]
MRGKIQKMQKETKMKFLDKIPSFLDKHKYLILVENTDLGSALLNKMREELENSDIMFVKKKMLSKKYNIVNAKNFFLVFTDLEGIEKLKKYQYETFLEVNDVSPENVIICKGEVKNKELAELIPTINEKNISILEDDYVVCRKNEALTDVQVRILKCLKKKLKKEFIKILHVYETIEIKENK